MVAMAKIKKKKRTALWVEVGPSLLRGIHKTAEALGYTTSSQWVRLVLQRAVVREERKRTKQASPPPPEAPIS